MNPRPQRRGPNLRGEARRAARVAAVQALYQLALTDENPDAVVEEFALHRLTPVEGVGPDRAMFDDLVRGTAGRMTEIDAVLTPCLAEGWQIERLDAVLRAILRAGGYELMARADVPARVAIKEYVAVAGDFFGGREPGFVNSVLDRIARRLRPEEFPEEGGDAAAPDDGTAG